MIKSIVAMIAVVFCIITVSAEVPELISYQGVLRDSLGELVEDDVYALKFSIYDTETEGALLWQSDGFVPIQIFNGVFTHVLGTTNSIPDSISRFSSLWLGINVDLDDELPRIQLTSAPFALSAQYTDTAGISLDKTIDAGELTAGTLDTGRYSAYDDLASENKIGMNPGQLAAGDHTHSIVSYPGAMTRYEDNSTVTIVNPSDTVAKSIIIPANEIDGFFRVSLVYKSIGYPSDDVYIDILVDGISVYSDFTQHFHVNAIGCLEIQFAEVTDNVWFLHSYTGRISTINPINNNYINEIAFNPADGLSIDVRVYSQGGTGATVTIGNFIVEYDVD